MSLDFWKTCHTVPIGIDVLCINFSKWYNKALILHF